MPTRTPATKKAKELAKYLRGEQPDYAYLKSVFAALRHELNVSVPRAPKTLPYVPSDGDIRAFYDAVWQSERHGDALLIKTLLYTGVRVSELVNLHLTDLDLDHCQLHVINGKGGKARVVPFPQSFKEALALHADRLRAKGATYLFESSWQKKYSERGVRRMLERYATAAGLQHTIAPHMLRHYLLTWLKRQGIDDALIQPYSGHASRQSLEVYSKLAIGDAQKEYSRVMPQFPV